MAQNNFESNPPTIRTFLEVCRKSLVFSIKNRVQEEVSSGLYCRVVHEEIKVGRTKMRDRQSGHPPVPSFVERPTNMSST